MAKKETGLALWNERLAELAKQTKKTASGIAAGGNFLSFKSGALSYQNASIAGNKMNVIIVDWILENQWYKSAYDANNPQTPDCYAFGRIRSEMAPNPEHVENPVSDQCHGCEKAQFGTADTGKGKACKECARLAVITEGDLDNLEDAEIALAKLPFFSATNLKAYVDQLLATYEKPPIAFITELSVTPDPKSQFRVNFKMIQEIDDPPAFEALWAKYEQAKLLIDAPYPKIEAAPEPPKRGKLPPPVPKASATKPRAQTPAAPKPTVSRKTTSAVAAPAEGKIKLGARRTAPAAKY